VYESETIDKLVAELTLEEKCRLLAGATMWRTAGVERLGIPAMKMSDGPNGVRGEHGFGGTATPSVVVPVGIVQGATWDPDLIGRIGDLLGKESRRKATHVLLAPAVNIQRTPIGGRTFEYYSEDPELTAALAVASVRGIQSHGVAVTVKHFAANDSEIDRNSVDVIVDERVLREIYLRPFEAAVKEAGAWGVMSAYNRLHGEFCSENRRLLTTILREEWGFDGAVVSDWGAAHEVVGCATAGLSIEMPAPAPVYSTGLAQAVADGTVEESAVDALVRDVLVLAERTSAWDRSVDEPEQSVDDPAERALCRTVAAAGTVLARNERGALPLFGPLSVAVVGPNAAVTRSMGGGSASLQSLPQRSILDALTARLPDLVHEQGCPIDHNAPPIPADRLVGPDGEPGLELRWINGTDPTAEPAVVKRTTDSVHAFFFALPDGVTSPCILQLRGAYVAAEDGPHRFGAIMTGRPSLRVGDEQVTRGGQELPSGNAFFGFASAEQMADLDLATGDKVEIEFELLMKQAIGIVRFGIVTPADATAMERAIEAARTSDAAVVVVGTSEDWESEGYDRTTIALPGDQDELVRRVAAVNDRTIVVVNAGAPVAMPWVDDVAAVVIPCFGGMEMGDAVADVLLGDADPGGRLPITYPRQLEDAPAWSCYRPVDGVQRYEEGFGVGYRGHDRSRIAPLFPFGHGLSYGDASWGDAVASTTTIRPGDSVTVTIPVTGAGPRPATVVVQGYVAPIDPPVDREPKALRTWAKTVVPGGATEEVTLTFGPEAFRRWDDQAGDWTIDLGAYDLHLAASATDIRATVNVTIDAA
jgi:beta-glucosidase